MLLLPRDTHAYRHRGTQTERDTYTYTHIHIRVNEELYCGDESCARLPFLFSLNLICCKILLLLPYDTYSRRSIKKKKKNISLSFTQEKDYWQNELKSLDIEPRRQNELLITKRSFRHCQKASRQFYRLSRLQNSI